MLCTAGGEDEYYVLGNFLWKGIRIDKILDTQKIGIGSVSVDLLQFCIIPENLQRISTCANFNHLNLKNSHTQLSGELTVTCILLLEPVKRRIICSHDH